MLQGLAVFALASAPDVTVSVIKEPVTVTAVVEEAATIAEPSAGCTEGDCSSGFGT